MGEDSESVNATILGHSVGIKGINMLVVVVLTVALAGAGFLLWERLQDQKVEHLQQTQQQTIEHESIVNALKAMQGVNEQIGELIDEQNYIVLSDEKERKAMKDKLQRPSSLSRKLKAETE